MELAKQKKNLYEECESKVENMLFRAFLPQSGYIFVENVSHTPRFRAKSAKTQRWVVIDSFFYKY
jgi:hypothetical protein